MCDRCSERLEALNASPAKVSAKWTCPACGPQEFAKEADPPALYSFWPDLDPGVVVPVVALLMLAAVMIVKTIYR